MRRAVRPVRIPRPDTTSLDEPLPRATKTLEITFRTADLL